MHYYTRVYVGGKVGVSETQENTEKQGEGQNLCKASLKCPCKVIVEVETWDLCQPVAHMYVQYTLDDTPAHAA